MARIKQFLIWLYLAIFKFKICYNIYKGVCPNHTPKPIREVLIVNQII